MMGERGGAFSGSAPHSPWLNRKGKEEGEMRVEKEIKRYAHHKPAADGEFTKPALSSVPPSTPHLSFLSSASTQSNLRTV